MKIAIISDIHANLEALQAVLANIATQNVDSIYCLGDAIGYGPNPCECIDHCFSFDKCILGNHDLGALYDPEGFSSGAEKAIFWTRDQLEKQDDPENKKRWRFLAELPRTIKQDDLMFVHGSARAPLTEYVFPEDIYNSKKIEKIFAYIDQYCFQGHTHVPGVFTIGGEFHSPPEMDFKYELGEEKVMVNVGSVGQPRDGDSRACYVTLTDKTVEFHRVEYSLETTRGKIHDIPYLDDFLGDRLLEGR